MTIKRVICIGDSLTHGVADLTSGGWVEMLASAMFPNVLFSNSGSTGNVLADEILRYEAAWKYEPKIDLVVGMLPFNNIRQGDTAASIEPTYLNFVNEVVSDGRKYLQVHWGPWKTYAQWTQQKQNEDDAFKAYMKTLVSSSIFYAEVQDVLASKADPLIIDPRFNVANGGADGLHPGTLGNQQIATKLQPSIQSILGL